MTDSTSQPPHDFLPTASIAHLRFRAQLLRQLRRFFDSHGFDEVHTPVLSSETIVDIHLEPFQVVRFADPQNPAVGPIGYLQTSPEIHMKRLLVAGAHSIYQVGPALRSGESGMWHNTEFTMVEWYRRGDDLQSGMRLLAELAETLLSAESTQFLSYQDAFERHVDVNPHTIETDDLRDIVIRTGQWSPPPSIRRDDLLEYLMSERVQTQLGRDGPVIVFDYPASQAALARVRDGQPPLAERFELFFRGIELANGYHELGNADEAERRFRLANEHRTFQGKPALPLPTRFLAAMRHGLPSCAGTALGFDRLAMLALGFKDIGQAVPFLADRA